MRLGLLRSIVLDRVRFRLFAYCCFTEGRAEVLVERYATVQLLFARYDQLAAIDQDATDGH